ncbi:hypothetical protein [Candidatus Formimonas warabiya]|uniref:Class I SAM-dependent methyltransferase n=1 Tax=Formimonas warabiya TaxID=1761012 RepID=A0A3G1L0E9_FORW1|nr:hypothetical protein [Candidatus Formimonas warabiya]ATW27955.1 hypothetical protein DCMF_27225 [Candidatus Formimonas warabiya]
MIIETKRNLTQLKKLVDNKKLPDNFIHLDIPMEFYDNKLGREMLSKTGFCLLYWDWLKHLVKFLKNKKCLEIMAGCGALSYFLQRSGINIKPTDNFCYTGDWNIGKNYWTDIEDIDCLDAIVKYGKNIDVIVLSWPSVRNITYFSLELMRLVNPNCVMVVIWEAKGEFSNKLFRDALIEIDNELIKKANKNYKGWYNDRIMLIK